MFTRLCPNCGKEISYQSNNSLNLANKNKSSCRKCASLATGFTDRYATKGKNTGKDNNFYGKKHSKETKNILSEQRKGKPVSEKQRKVLSEHCKGKNNSMYGRTFYEVWLEKYGKDEADRRLVALSAKHSKNNSGSGNPMYGKPSPQGSGNGWKGWYKGFFFRSLRELCYILYLEENNINWLTGETLKIKYEFFGSERTYRPDFIIGNKLIEIKPIKLHNTPNIQAKTKAAIEYCKNNNMVYELIDVDIDIKLIERYIDKIKFKSPYDKRIEQWLK